jgi:hypothetical protein
MLGGAHGGPEAPKTFAARVSRFVREKQNEAANAQQRRISLAIPMKTTGSLADSD